MRTHLPSPRLLFPGSSFKGRTKCLVSGMENESGGLRFGIQPIEYNILDWILPIFAHGAIPGRIYTWSYDENDQDFTKGAYRHRLDRT